MNMDISKTVKSGKAASVDNFIIACVLKRRVNRNNNTVTNGDIAKIKGVTVKYFEVFKNVFHGKICPFVIQIIISILLYRCQ